MNRLLYRGCTPGEDVRILQNDLNAAAALPLQKSGLAPLDADGTFGPKTAGRVQEFQALNGLTADGVVGPKTLGSLSSVLQDAPSTPAVHPVSGVPAIHPVSGGAIYSGGPPYGKLAPSSGGKTYKTSGKSYGGSGAGGGSGSGSGGGTKSW
jgi:peptidoglycan hydrolase-like protein with peptidoglycan-binding domain